MGVFLRIATIFSMLAPISVVAQDYNAGLTAFRAGDYAAALREWSPLAQQGDIYALHALAYMHAHGKGVMQNDAQAFRLFRAAAERGDADSQTSVDRRLARRSHHRNNFIPSATALGCPHTESAPFDAIVSADGTELYTPITLNVRGGGGFNLSDRCLPLQGVGFVNTFPTIQFGFISNSANRKLRIRALADCDMVLLVNSPDGLWHFNDGYDGKDISLDFPSARIGRYDIFVGSHTTSLCNANVVLETF